MICTLLLRGMWDDGQPLLLAEHGVNITLDSAAGVYSNDDAIVFPIARPGTIMAASLEFQNKTLIDLNLTATRVVLGEITFQPGAITIDSGGLNLESVLHSGTKGSVNRRSWRRMRKSLEKIEKDLSR